jgi:hypothetical protein
VAGLKLGKKCACTYSHSRCLPSVQVVPLSYFLLCIEKNYSRNMARTRQKLPTAPSHDINTSGIVEEGRSSPDCLDENSSAYNVSSSSSRDRSPSPEEVFFVEDLNLTRSNDPVELDAPLLLYWSNPVSQVLRAMAVKRTTRGRSNFSELMTVKIS